MLPVLLFTLAFLLIYLFLKLRTSDHAYFSMNQVDWKIHLLPRPSLFIRIFNILVGHWGAWPFIALLEKTLIETALKKSDRQMEIAEASGVRPWASAMFGMASQEAATWRIL